jgi:hypothetical protein
MSLFQCCKCGCAEDTTLCHYWSARVRDVRPMCSACDPSIGQWHGEFARVPFKLQHKQEVEQWLGLSLDFPPESVRISEPEHCRALRVLDLQLRRAAGPD